MSISYAYPKKQYFKEWLKFYACLGLAGLVWSVTPLDWAVVAFRVIGEYNTSGQILVSAPSHWFLRLLWFHALCDVPFSLYLTWLFRHAKREHPPPQVAMEILSASLNRALSPSSEEATTEKNKELTLAKLRRWFYHAEADDIREDNVREWLAWAFGGTELEACQKDPRRNALIESGLYLVQEQCGVRFKPGYNPKVKALRLTLDDIKTAHRPFGYYVVCNGISYATLAWLRCVKGFQKECHGKCEFLVLPPSRSGGDSGQDDVQSRPILFLHGLGIGLGQYIPFLKRLSTHKGGVVILLQPNISADIWHRQYLDPPSKDELIEAMMLCTQRHGFSQSTILSHSNGTMVHGWLLREAPKIAHRHVLVDPVCFRLWEGATSFAFLAKRWSSGIEVLLGYFVARELGISYTICRKFIWWDMILWAEDLVGLDRDRLQIIMGSNDVLIDVASVQDYLKSWKVHSDQIHIHRGAQHGQALFLPSAGMRDTCHALGLTF